MKVKLLLISIFFVAASCTSYLDLKPYGKVIPKTAEEYSAMIHKILDNIEQGNESIIIENNSTVSTNETMADNLDANIFLTKDNYSNYLGERINNRNSEYSSLYANIRNCNIVIEGLKEDNTELAKTVIGTAKAIRGVCYYHLLRGFCEPVVAGAYPELGLPIVETFDMEYRPIRSSYKATVDFIVADFNASLGASISENKYLFTSDVVKGFLARLYFWVGDWDNAMPIAKELLDKHPLLSGDAYLEMMKSNAIKGNVLIKSTTNRTSDDSTIETSLTKRPINKTYIDLFDYKEKDIRYTNFFTTKRENRKKLFGGMRSAEWIFILAESYCHKNENEKALVLMNDFRRKRITDYVDLTLDKLKKRSVALITKDAMGKDLTPVISLILNERRAEFLMEGDRLFELKRNGTPEFWISRNGLAYITQKYMYTYPLPISDLELVNGLIQNKGYSKFENN